MGQTVLFKQEGQHIYDYTNVYDPDVHGSDPANSGKIIPAVRSIVIDNRTSDWKVLLVNSVDPVTFKCSYIDFPYKTYDQRSMIMNYGNDVFMLYYDKRTSPTRLNVDAKLIIFSANIATYRLVKDGVTISYRLDEESGYVVSQIPVVDVTDQYVDGVRRCVNCYTTQRLVDGDVVTLELYDSYGVMVAEIELIARQSTILNSHSSAFNPIIKFTAEANQVDGENWYLYKGQDPSNLSIFPMVKFADGTSVVVPCDNKSCFIYGLDEIDTQNVGQTYPVLVKYYINNRYEVDPSLNIVAGTKRVLVSEHRVTIIDRPVGTISKISVIPVWNDSAERYDLKFFAYNTNRDGVSDVTAKIVDNNGNILSSALVSGSFSPNAFGVQQTFEVTVPISVGESDFGVDYQQQFIITLKRPSDVPSTGNGRDHWLIVDPNSDGQIVYGVDNEIYNRPVVFWDSEAGKHYISNGSSEFPTVADFLEVFYRLSSPPYLPDAGESQAPVPTHYRFRNVNGNVLTSIIGVKDYHQGIEILNAGVPVSGGTLVMEFLICNNGRESANIYGVPVLVEQADGTYIEPNQSTNS